jgi:hypothetical protein
MPHRAYNGSFAHPKVQRIQELAEVFAFLDGRPRP